MTKTEQLCIRFAPAERQILEAGARGRPLGTFIREVALEAAKLMTQPIPDVESQR